MAILRMTKMQFYAHHGVSDDEKEKGGNFEVDCEIETDITKCASSDDLNDTIDYSAVLEIIRMNVEGNRFNLLETIAERLKKEIINKTGARKVTVRIRKMEPPVEGNMDYFEVETS